MKTIDKLCDIMTADKSRGIVAYLDADDNATSACTLKTPNDAFFLLGFLIVQLSLRTNIPVRDIILNVTQAAHLIDSNNKCIEERMKK